MQSDAVFLEAGSGVFFQLVMDRRRHGAQSQQEIEGLFVGYKQRSDSRSGRCDREDRLELGFNFRLAADSFFSSVSQSVSSHI